MEIGYLVKKGFIKAFLQEYDEKFNDNKRQKDRLKLFISEKEEDKERYLSVQLEEATFKINNTSFDELAFAYIQSCDPASGVNFIESTKRYDFWLKRFGETVEDHINRFNPITHAYEILFERHMKKDYDNKLLDDNKFWSWYPSEKAPSIQMLSLNYEAEVTTNERIENWIIFSKDFETNIDFEKFQALSAVNKSVEILLDLTTLFANLNRWQELKMIQGLEEKEEEKKELRNEEANENVKTQDASSVKENEKGYKGHNEKINLKPTISEDKITALFNLLKGHFEAEQHSELKTLLETGENVNEKLLFKGNAIRLTDTFKQLIEKDIIAGCQKKDLEKWLIANFKFYKGGKSHELSPETTHKNISGKNYICKNPIIKVVEGKILNH